MSRATKRYKSVGDVKSKAKVLRFVKVKTV